MYNRHWYTKPNSSLLLLIILKLLIWLLGHPYGQNQVRVVLMLKSLHHYNLYSNDKSSRIHVFFLFCFVLFCFVFVLFFVLFCCFFNVLVVVDIKDILKLFNNPSPSSADGSWMLTDWFTPELAVDGVLVLGVSSKESYRHLNATKSYLHFCCFAGEAILFQIVGSSKQKNSWIELKFYCFFMI